MLLIEDDVRPLEVGVIKAVGRLKVAEFILF